MDAKIDIFDGQKLFQQDRPVPESVAEIQFRTFNYFWLGSHPVSGLARDRIRSDGTAINEIASTSGTGFAFMAVVVGAARGWITRDAALERVTTMVGSLGRARRFHGAFAHFLHGNTCDVIPFGPKDDGGDLVETALLIQGLMCARQYFSRPSLGETRFRTLANDLITGVEWSWFTRKREGALWWHWSPRFRWCFDIEVSGWNEALICYVLAAGAQQHFIEPAHYHKGWARSGAMVNGATYMGTVLPLGEPYGGPLFLSQYSFCGLDPRGLSDRYADYWTQVTAHTRINHDYCLSKYSIKGLWGLTASDDPSGYAVHSPTHDDSVISPTAALSSMPFLPEEAMEAAQAFLDYGDGKLVGSYGFVDAFSPSTGWVADTHLAID